MVMRFLHCTVGSLVLALAGTAAAQEPPQARPPEPADVTQFTVFLKGAPVGTVEVSVERGPAGITISGSSRLGPPLSLVVRNVEIRYDPDWKPLAYTLDSAIRNLVLRVRTKFAGGTATSDVTQVDKSLKKTDAVALDTVVLPGAFYGAYEALAARLVSAAPGTELRGYIVPQAEVAIKVTAVTQERIEAPGRSVATRHYLISMAIPDGPTDIDLWNDSAGRLVRLSVPTQSLDVVRADVATVAARREVAVRPGDEIVRVPGNGFVLGATVSRPPGGAKAGSVKLPAVVLVGSSGSADRNETVARVPIFAQLAGSLADAGFLVVRYDKRGTGESGGRIETATISDYADDADAVVRYLEKRKDVDKKRIAMVANDDGVWTALLAASRSGRVAALGLIGGAGSTGAQVTLAQQQRALGRMSISDAEKLARVELQQKIQKAVVSGTGWEGVPPADAQAGGHAVVPELPAVRPREGRAEDAAAHADPARRAGHAGVDGRPRETRRARPRAKRPGGQGGAGRHAGRPEPSPRPRDNRGG